jgi:hypothetical protein
MTYPGNQSLASDVQQRISSTFEHTLGLAEKGSRQEALLGCDFVLRMDPLFEPARRLQERLEATSGPLAVEDLRRGDAPMAPAAQPELPGAPDAIWADLEGLASELPDLPDPHAAPGPGALRAEFESLLSARRFQELQLRARQEAAAVAADLELQSLERAAQERLEAGPYVSKFLQSARDAMRAGNTAEGNRLLDKVRALDPTHPGIAELSPPGRLASGALGASAGPGSAAAGASGLPAALAPGSAAPSLVPAPAAALRPPPASPGTPPMSPVPPAPAGPPVNADTESERRIQQLLDEGQAALDGGDPQAAIDAWSRIFLIDIDHQEAAHRIDRARRIKAERDRQVEETFHDGLSRLEANDPDGARGAFQRVIELQPGHLQAREYLQQLDEGNVPAVGGAGRPGAARTLPSLAGLTPLAPMPAMPPMIPPDRGAAADDPSSASAVSGASAPSAPLPPLPADLAHAAGASDLAADDDLQEEILVPPDVSQAAHPPDARREVRSASAAHAGRARRLFLVVGSAVLLLALAVGWFLYQKREQWFPNSRTEEPAPAPAPNPIPRATKLHHAGKVAIALAQLSRVPPGDPHYKEAQALIAKWQAEPAEGPAAAGAPGQGAAGAPSAAAGAQPGAPEAGPLPGADGASGAAAAGAAGADPERRQALIQEARQAYKESAFLLAAQRYGAADRLGKLDADDAAQLKAAKQKLVPLESQINLFLAHNWEFALRELWRVHQSDPANRDVTRMIVDSYYDLGVRDLQHNEVAKAEQKFTEAKNLAPDDPGVKRQLVFAQTYLTRGPDLLYKIYVKYLPIR